MNNQQIESTDLRAHWLLCVAFGLMLLIYNFVCLVWGDALRWHLAETDRVLIRSILYALSIVLFPLVKLLRHVLLRLNQTMPGISSAKQRYWITICVVESLIQIIGLFGVAMYMLGDDVNTLYIFSGLSFLGIFLHKPNFQEYSDIDWVLRQTAESKT